MNKKDLDRYISMRRNAINELLVTPDIFDNVELIKMESVLEELKGLEEWFNE